MSWVKRLSMSSTSLCSFIMSWQAVSNGLSSVLSPKREGSSDIIAAATSKRLDIPSPRAARPAIAATRSIEGLLRSVRNTHTVEGSQLTAPVIDRLNDVVQQVENDPAVVTAWAATDVMPYPKDQRSPQAARALLQSEIARWAQVVRENGIQPPGQ